jgi:hypothetical protein
MSMVAGALVLLTVATSNANSEGESTATADAINLAKTVKVLGQTLTLKDTKGTSATAAFIAEYIPDSETFDNWTFMFASRLIPDPNLSAIASAAATARKIQAKKEAGDIFANAMVMENEKDKSAVVDFMISAGPDAKAGKVDVIEHNLFRYVQTPEGLLSFQLARRVYPAEAGAKSVEEFIKNTATDRKEYMNALTASDLPLPDFLRK